MKKRQDTPQMLALALETLTMRCERCGHQWLRRLATPKKCPACQNPFKYSARKAGRPKKRASQ